MLAELEAGGTQKNSRVIELFSSGFKTEKAFSNYNRYSQGRIFDLHN